MGDLLIRGMPEALKQDIRKAARKDGQSLSAKAIEMLQRGVSDDISRHKPSAANAWEEIRFLYENAGIIGDEYASVMDEIEAERKGDFGRPASDLE